MGGVLIANVLRGMCACVQAGLVNSDGSRHPKEVLAACRRLFDGSVPVTWN
jgi:hypothetical protein